MTRRVHGANGRTTTTRREALGALAALAVAACGRPAPSQGPRRCAFCGMRIPAGSHWEAGATSGAGEALAFDTPACLFRLRHTPRGAGMRGEWVTEYYGPAGRRTPARTVRYVVGSDVIGPMGADVIPVDPARVATFRADHHGRADYGFDDVTPAVIAAL